MVLLLDKLNNFLERNESFAVFGTGRWSDFLYDNLCSLGVEKKIDIFLKTKADKKNHCGKPLLSLQEYIKKDVTVLIATRIEIMDEIIFELKKNGFMEHVSLWEFIRDDSEEDILKKLENGNINQLKDYIKDWYLYKNIQDYYNSRNCLVQNINNLMEKTIDTKRNSQLIYIIDYVTARSVRILSALKNRAKEIVVIQLKREKRYAGQDELFSFFNVIECECYEEIIYNLFLIKAKNIIVEAVNFIDASLAEIIVRYKFFFNKIIFTTYDICTGTYINLPEFYYKSEKYVLENSDGIIWRYYSKSFLEEKFNFEIKGQNLFFYDCCDIIKIDDSQKQKDGNILRICSVPTHASVLLNDYCGEFVHDSTLKEILENIGKRNDCIFHVYLWNATESEKKLLDQYEKDYGNFKYFIHLKRTDLLKKMEEYDYGASFYSGSIIPRWPNVVPGTKYTEGSYLYGMCNKYFEYLSSGLPIIANYPLKICEQLKQDGCLIDMTPDNLNFSFLKKNLKKYKNRVKEVRKKYSIDNQIGKLISFMDEIYEK